MTEKKVEFRHGGRDKYSLLPVTALQFCCVGEAEFLLGGEGPKLKVFTKDGLLLCEEEVLPFNRVHGLVESVHQCCSKQGALLLVFGEKRFRIVRLVKEEDSFKLSTVSEVLLLQDWILAGVLLNYHSGKQFEVALVTAHNALVVYGANGDINEISTHHSEVNCILYSARVEADSVGDLIVVSGTVFNQIIVWCVSGSDRTVSGDKVVVRLALNGHNGAIFSVRLSDERVVSVSDDRTIRMWNLPSHWKRLERFESNACSLVLYGHTARVWDAVLLPNCIVSIGEDATCRVWDCGQCLSVVEGHRGRSIWSMAVDREKKIVATAGGDCSIRMFHLESLKGSTELTLATQLPPSKSSLSDVPRSVMLYKNTALTLTANGWLYAASVDGSLFEQKLSSSTMNSSVWKEIHVDPEYSGYCVVSLSQYTPGWLALGNLQGCIKLIKLAATGEVAATLAWAAHKGKIFSLNWCGCVPHQLLFSCGPVGRVSCWQVTMADAVFEVTEVACMDLPPSKHRWISAVLVLQSEHDAPSHLVILGDRKGSIHVFKCSLDSHSRGTEGTKDSITPLQSTRVHGPNGVTFFTEHDGYIYSAGRDGTCRQYSLSREGLLNEVTKFKPVKGMDWIEELMFTDDDDLLVLGFHTTNMVLHSTRQNKHIVCINCGGGHRSYGFSSKHEITSSRKASIVYIKQSTLHFMRFNLDSYFTKVLFQPSFAGREVVSLAVIASEADSALLAVGSEDCSIYIVRLHPRLRTPIRVERTLESHISSVRALSCSSCSFDKRKKLLFSGGARASLKTWSLVEDGLTISLEAEKCLHEVRTSVKKSKKPFSFDGNVPPECRILSLTSFPVSCVSYHGAGSSAGGCHYLAAGCSDGLIRQFIYNEMEKTFMTLQTLTYHDKCILVVRHHLLSVIKEKSQGCESPPLQCPAILCSCATDGKLALWDLQPILSSRVHPESDVKARDCRATNDPKLSKEGAVSPVTVMQPHQSGVNDIAIHCNGYNDATESYLISIATVGDDNALVLTHLRLQATIENTRVTLVHQCSLFRAHASSITGVHFVQSDHILTASIDQRINLWVIDSSSSLTLLSSYTHDVADVSSLGVCRFGSCVYAVLCGIGIQYYCLQQS